MTGGALAAAGRWAAAQARHLALPALLLTAGAPPSFADFAEGLAAFDGGDYEAALEAWQPLAEAGDVEAQVALAELYQGGLGLPPDAARAAYWYRRAAEQGDPVAQLNLGDFYSRGLGVARDLVEAYVWLSLSAAQGRQWPERRRREIAAALSPARLAEAERLILVRSKTE